MIDNLHASILGFGGKIVNMLVKGWLTMAAGQIWSAAKRFVPAI